MRILGASSAQRVQLECHYLVKHKIAHHILHLCIYIYVCVFIHIRIHIFRSPYTYIHVYANGYIYIYIYIMICRALIPELHSKWSVWVCLSPGITEPAPTSTSLVIHPSLHIRKHMTLAFNPPPPPPHENCPTNLAASLAAAQILKNLHLSKP